MTKAPAPTKVQGAFKNAVNSRDSIGKSTKTEDQLRRIIAALKVGPKTTDELRSIGCYQVSARIFGLRARGYNILTELFDGYAVDGMHHSRMARYTLLDQPEGGAQ